MPRGCCVEHITGAAQKQHNTLSCGVYHHHRLLTWKRKNSGFCIAAPFSIPIAQSLVYKHNVLVQLWNDVSTLCTTELFSTWQFCYWHLLVCSRFTKLDSSVVSKNWMKHAMGLDNVCRLVCSLADICVWSESRPPHHPFKMYFMDELDEEDYEIAIKVRTMSSPSPPGVICEDAWNESALLCRFLNRPAIFRW